MTAFGEFDEYASQNATIGSFGTHTEIIWAQFIGLENDLRDLDLDREENVYFGMPDLAIYGAAFFGVVELEEVTVSFMDLAGIAFFFDLTAGYMNYNVWADVTGTSWATAYSLQFATGVLGLVSLALEHAGVSILLNASLLYILMQFGVLATVTMAESDNANTTDNATTISYVASAFGILVASAANVWYRVLDA